MIQSIEWKLIALAFLGAAQRSLASDGGMPLRGFAAKSIGRSADVRWFGFVAERQLNLARPFKAGS